MGILNLLLIVFQMEENLIKKKIFKTYFSMINSGAKIIDVGGESTRPGSKTINPNIEWKRVEFVLKNFKKKYKKLCLSIDTRKSDCNEKILKCGVDIINDVSGFEL